MTIETLQQANELHTQIMNLQSRLDSIDNALAKPNDELGQVRLRGLDVAVKHATLKGDLNKQKTDIEAELTTLQTQFDAL